VGLLAGNLKENKVRSEITLTETRRFEEREKGKDRLRERMKKARRVV
jgi:hypothetical protein